MAGDARSATGLRRQNSTASGHSSLTLQQRTPTTAAFEEVVEPVSAHVADPFLHDFLQPGFDPAAYWNAALGTASPVKSARGSTTTTTTTTADQAATAQEALSQLAAHTTRLTTVLSQLTDDILRSGSRLAYEVELLRGETIGLAEVLDKMGQELPGSADVSDPTNPKTPTDSTNPTDPALPISGSAPPALAQLRMLAQVRSRLDAVIRTFGDAMEFVMPPSALSVGASFLSVSGPEAGAGKTTPPAAVTPPTAAGTDTKSLEDKGQQVLRVWREEIARLLENKDGLAGVEAAGARVAALRALCQVWTGTAEEKARLKFVDGLQRMVEDRQRQLEREKQAEEQAAAAAVAKLTKTAISTAGGKDGGGSGGGTSAASSASSATQDAGTASSTAAAATQGKGSSSYAGYGFISQLQKIRGGL